MSYIFVLLYTFVVLVRPHEFYAPLGEAPLMPILLICGFVGWITRGGVKSWTPQHTLAILLLVAMTLSQIAIGWAGGIPDLMVQKLPVILLFFMLTSLVDTPSRFRLFILVVVFSAVIMACHGILQIETGVGWTGARTVEGSRITYIGIFNDPNDLGQVFATSLPMVAYLFSISSNWLIKLIYLIFGGAITYGAYLTNSRGTVLALMAIAGLFVYQKYGKAKAIVLGVVGAPVLALMSTRMDTANTGDESAAGRVEAWYVAIDLFRESPLFGVGVGGFVDHHYLTAHNSYLLVLAELGFFGYFCWLSFVMLCFYMMVLFQRKDSYPIPSSDKENDEIECAIGVSRCMLYALLAYFSSAFFLSRSFSIVLFILCGLATAHYINIRRSWPSVLNLTFSSIFMRLLAAVIGSIVSLFLVVRVLMV